jgi:putative phage-type endonuclease
VSRPFTIIDAEQRSPAWFAARAGRLTGSEAGNIVATLKSGGEPAGRRDLRTRLVLERLCGRSLEDDYQNGDMRRGIEREAEARLAYETLTGHVVQTTGFLAHNQLLIGCSLDGHLGDFDTIVEIKCPRPANHLKYLKAEALPPEHRYQIVHNLFVSGAARADFCSYCPEFPEPLDLFYVQVQRDDAEIKSYELLVRMFLKEIEQELATIEQLRAVPVAV